MLSDIQIADLCKGDRAMITPFRNEQVREIYIDDINKSKAISFGCSSYGYDIRLAPSDFRIFKKRNIWQKLGLQTIPIIDPKRFDPSVLYRAELYSDASGDYFVMPPHSAALGVSIERFDMPINVTAHTLGKSTYARCAIDQLGTPLEAGWQGHLTLEFSNSSDFPCKIYANEGVIQLAFDRGENCQNPYNVNDRKYQDQGCEVTLARV